MPKIIPRDRSKLRKHRRIQRLTVRFVHALPQWPELVQEARSYHGQLVHKDQVIAFARHTYTNYESLCRRLHRSVSGFVNQQQAAEFKRQANQLIAAHYSSRSAHDDHLD